MSGVVGAALLLLAAVLDLLPNEGSARAFSVVVLLCGAALVLSMLLQELVRGRRREAALRRANEALERIDRAFGATVETSDIAFDHLVDHLVQGARATMRSDWCSIALTDDAGVLRVAATSGTGGRTVGDPVAADSIPVAGSTDPIAVSLTFDSGAVGVLEVGGAPDHGFSREERSMLRLVANRVMGAVDHAEMADAERRSRLGAVHARSQLAVIAESSMVLARALEDLRPAVIRLVDVLVQSFADLCIVHLSHPSGRIERIAAKVRDGDVTGAEARPMTGDLEGTEAALQRVMAAAQSELAYVRRDGTVDGVDDRFARALRERGIQSWIISPVTIRGLPVGAVIVGTGRARRGYRPSDRAAVDELAGRLAIATERAALYSETREAALEADRRAEQLSMLLDAAISLDPTSSQQAVLDALVEHAARVLDAPHAHAWLAGEQGFEASDGAHPSDALRLGQPLVDAAGHENGFLTVERERGRPFSPDDEAMLALLGRAASAAVENAQLYGDVRLREQQLQALFEASPLAVLELDLRGKVLAANGAAHDLFPADDGAREVTFPPVVREKLNELTLRAMEGTVGEAEVSLQSEPSDRLDLWIATAPVCEDGAQTPRSVVVVVSDSTERKRLEDQLTQAHRWEAIAHLAGGVAHDFNNLLTIINGYSELLLQELSQDSQAAHDVAAIHQAGQVAAVITNQLLTLSRNQIVNPVVVPLAARCQSMESMLRRLAGDGVRVHGDYYGNAHIQIDAGQLEQVVFNLVLNGRDAMPEGGDIDIVTEDRGDRAVLVVADTGVGMDAVTAARCLEPFFTTKGRRGIGLGLATVATIVQRARGALEIDSAPGEGTRVTVTFPTVGSPTIGSRAGEATAAAALDGAATVGRRWHILLVDDDELVRRFAEKALRDAGFDVTAVADAAEALAAADRATAQGGQLDLLLSDVVLPGTSGPELARAFAARWPATAVLLMTGFAPEATAGGIDAMPVLKKPFSAEELAAAADQTLRYGSKR